MTDSGNPANPLSADLPDPLASLAKGLWWWVLIRGILAVLFGIIALVTPGAALTAIALVFGAYALVDGVVTIAHAIRIRSSFRQWGWLLVQGVLSALAGLAALILPSVAGTFGGLVVLWTFVIWNVMHGIAGIRSAAGAAEGRGRTWAIVAGAFSVLFGIVLAILVLVTPVAAVLGLVFTIGLYAIIFGVMLIVAAVQVRTAVTRPRTRTSV